MIGVDIVDLHQNFNRRSQESYLNKLAGMDEVPLLHFPYPVHLLWAIKEAVYKCHYQQRGEKFMNPKKIKIREVHARHLTFTAHCGSDLYTGVFFTGEDYIYAVAWSFSSPPTSTVFITYLSLHQNHTPEKEMLYYAYELGEDVSLESANPGFPSLLRTHQHTYAYSRSHDGRWYVSMIGRGIYLNV